MSVVGRLRKGVSPCVYGHVSRVFLCVLVCGSQRPDIFENSQVGWRTDLIMPAGWVYYCAFQL